MKQFPDESIDLVIFSPPYYGLRVYGIGDPVVWDDNPECKHEWVESRVKKSGGRGKKSKKQVTNVGSYFETVSSQCKKCGAIICQLGLEPTWQVYIEHLTEICSGIKRILKKSGSMYIVIGDTYSSALGIHGNTTAGFSRKKMVRDSHKPRRPKDYPLKCLMGIPWRLAFNLISSGWTLRNSIVWHKPNAMPTSVKDRLKPTYEFMFHFVKATRYYYNLDMIREPIKYKDKLGDLKEFCLREYQKKKTKRIPYNMKAENAPDSMKSITSWTRGSRETMNEIIESLDLEEKVKKRLRTWWHDSQGHPLGKNPGDMVSINTKPFTGAHFATFPLELLVKPILSSCPPNGIVLDPFVGSGTVPLACELINRQEWAELHFNPNHSASSTNWRLRWIGIDVIEDYLEIARERLKLYLTHPQLN